MKAEVFISYSSKDTKFAEDIAAFLEQLNISYWKAPEHIPAGSSYAKEIPAAIKECRIFLLLLSANAQDSIWVEKEIDQAISLRKTLIPIQMDTQKLNDTFGFYLNNVQMISFVDKSRESYDELKKKLFFSLQKEEAPQHKLHDRAVVTQSEMLKSSNRRVTSFSPNRIPIVCDKCGGKIEMTRIGVYVCKACKHENFDDFQTIRNLLNQKGPMPAALIARETKVPRSIIEYFFKEEYLEIPNSSSFRIRCKKCNNPIRTGEYCEACKAARS